MRLGSRTWYAYVYPALPSLSRHTLVCLFRSLKSLIVPSFFLYYLTILRYLRSYMAGLAFVCLAAVVVISATCRPPPSFAHFYHFPYTSPRCTLLKSLPFFDLCPLPWRISLPPFVISSISNPSALECPFPSFCSFLASSPSIFTPSSPCHLIWSITR